MTVTRARLRVILATVLSTFAVGCMTLAAYLYSIEWGALKHPELMAAVCGSAAAAVLAIGGAAFIISRRLGIGAVVRSCVLLTAGCCAVTATLFLSLLANCRLSCGNRVVAESKSPDGEWTAIWLLESCAAAARYCPPISHIVLLRDGERLPGGEGEAFSVRSADGVGLEWKSNDRLVISYAAWTKVLRKRSRVGIVRLEYLPIASM
jgi:hypothetical protein